MASIGLRSASDPDVQDLVVVEETNEEEVNLTKWKRMFSRRGSLREFMQQHSETFLRRVRRGIPPEFRWETWRIAISTKTVTDVHYSNLTNTENPFTNQIRVDMPRTIFLKEFGSEEQQQALLRILNAFANLDPVLGYCQGMNFVVGTLLIVAKGQERATFEALCGLMAWDNLRNFYSDRFPLLRRYMDAFNLLLRQELPELAKHFHNIGIPTTAYLTPWLMSLYSANLPFETVLVVWDTILCEGLLTSLCIAVALLKSLEQVLLRLDLDQCSELFKSMRTGDEECDARTIGRLLVKNAAKVRIPKEVYTIVSDPDYEPYSPGEPPQDLSLASYFLSSSHDPEGLQFQGSKASTFKSWINDMWSQFSPSSQTS